MGMLFCQDGERSPFSPPCFHAKIFFGLLHTVEGHDGKVLQVYEPLLADFEKHQVIEYAIQELRKDSSSQVFLLVWLSICSSTTSSILHFSGT